MLLEKAIRKRQLNVPPVGHQELDSHVISGLPLMDLNPQVENLSFLDDLASWPHRLDLLVHWQQTPVPMAGVFVQEIVAGKPLPVAEFYSVDTADKPEIATHARNQSIIFNYKNLCRIYGEQGEGVIYGCSGSDITLHIPEHHQIYQKTYACQLPGNLVQSRQHLGDDRWMTTSPKGDISGANLVPLLSYGCFAPTGCELSELEETYVSIGTNGKDTTLRHYKESQLRKEGVTLPHGGVVRGWRYQFIDALPQTSPVADIMNHAIRIIITMNDVQKVYVSASHRTCSQSEQLIYLTFIPE